MMDERCWVKCKSMATFLDVSRDTIERRAIPWQEAPVPHRFRYKLLHLAEGTDPERRYYFPDAASFLHSPPSQRRQVAMVPLAD